MSEVQIKGEEALGRNEWEKAFEEEYMKEHDWLHACLTGDCPHNDQHECFRACWNEALKRFAAPLAAENAELRGVLDLKQDEYVQQVGTWKIISRLEEERDELRREVAELISHRKELQRTCEKQLSEISVLRSDLGCLREKLKAAEALTAISEKPGEGRKCEAIT